MKPATGLGLTIALAAALVAPSAAAAITRDERVGIKAGVHKLTRPKIVCSRYTDEFLQETFAADGPKGRKRCRKDVRRELKAGPVPKLERLKIVKATGERARVRVVVTSGARAAFILVKTPRGWLLDGVENLHGG